MSPSRTVKFVRHVTEIRLFFLD